MKNPKVSKFFDTLLDNLGDVITIVVTASLIVWQERNPLPPEEISRFFSWLLAVLGLIAISGIWDRTRRMRRIEVSVQKAEELSLESYDLIQRHIEGLVSAKNFLKTHNGLKEDFFFSATEIILTGVTLQYRVKQLTNVLEERLKVGAAIKLVLVEPNESNLVQMRIRGWGEASIEYYKGLIESTITQIDVIASNPLNKGRVEVGFVPFYPSIAFQAIKAESGDEKCWVNILSHKTTKPTPAFILQKSTDPDWYSYFYEQFNLLWQSCRIENFPRKRLNQ
jgi:hypothetical protein